MFSEVIEKLKDAILLGNLTRATETAINMSSGAILNTPSSQNVVREPRTAAKRHRPKGRK